MELDTGTAMSIISEATYKNLWEVPPKLEPTTTRLRMYSGQQLVVLVTLNVKVKYKAQQVTRTLLVVEGLGPSLFRRNWLEVIKLDWKGWSVQYNSMYQSLIKGHAVKT